MFEAYGCLCGQWTLHIQTIIFIMQVGAAWCVTLVQNHSLVISGSDSHRKHAGCITPYLDLNLSCALWIAPTRNGSEAVFDRAKDTQQATEKQVRTTATAGLFPTVETSGSRGYEGPLRVAWFTRARDLAAWWPRLHRPIINVS